MNKTSLLTPNYYHREYSNDIKQNLKEPDFSDQCKRVALVALPFISLYKPVGFSLSLGMGALRVASNLSTLYAATQESSTKEISYQVIQTAVAAASVVGTIIAHPLGMLISTGQDIASETITFTNHLYGGEYTKAAESGANIVNNALYLGMFVSGGMELSIASLGTQILIGLYHSQKEFKDGHWLEGCGHLAMAGIRLNQMQGQIQMLQYKRGVKKLFAEQESTSSSQRSKLQKCESGKRRSMAKTIHCSTTQASFPETTEILAKYDNNPEGIPPLLYATEKGDFDAVKLLVERGDNINQITQNPKSMQVEKKCPIVSALRYPKILNFLIDSGADLDIRLTQKRTPLHFAAQSEDSFESLCILIQRGANVNAVDLYQQTPLHIGIFSNKIAFALIDNGANIHAIDHMGTKPLHIAYTRRDLPLLKKLVAKGASLSECGSGSPIGGNALHYALSHTYNPNSFELIRFLIEEQKMDVNAYSRYHDGKTGANTAFMWAIDSQKGLEDDFTILNYLLQHGANVNAKIMNGQTVLARAKSQGIPYYVIDWLVQHGAK